jgi:hypothetical protein
VRFAAALTPLVFEALTFTLSVAALATILFLTRKLRKSPQSHDTVQANPPTQQNVANKRMVEKG